MAAATNRPRVRARRRAARAIAALVLLPAALHAQSASIELEAPGDFDAYTSRIEVRGLIVNAPGAEILWQISARRDSRIPRPILCRARLSKSSTSLPHLTAARSI